MSREFSFGYLLLSCRPEQPASRERRCRKSFESCRIHGCFVSCKTLRPFANRFWMCSIVCGLTAGKLYHGCTTAFLMFLQDLSASTGPISSCISFICRPRRRLLLWTIYCTCCTRKLVFWLADYGVWHVPLQLMTAGEWSSRSLSRRKDLLLRLSRFEFLAKSEAD